jgi:proliferating cell nuclear antigen
LTAAAGIFQLHTQHQQIQTMFEARLTQGVVMKQVIEAIKDLVKDCNLDCSEEEVSIQSMDSAHVSLVAVRLGAAAFDQYRCDRPNALGINTANMSKIFKMLNNDDVVTLKAEDEGDALTMLFEGNKKDTIADFGKCTYSIQRTTLLPKSYSLPHF